MAINTWKIRDKNIEFQANDITVISDDEAISQRVKARIELWLNEWFLAQAVTGSEQGFDWEDVLSSSAQPERIKEELRLYIQDDVVVDKIDEISINFDRSSRKLSVDWKGTAVAGFGIDGSSEVA